MFGADKEIDVFSESMSVEVYIWDDFQYEITCVVYENVQSFLALDELAGELPDGPQAAEVQVSHHDLQVARVSPDLLGGVFGLLEVATGEDDPGASPGQVQGRHPADARVATSGRTKEEARKKKLYQESILVPEC